MDYLHMLTTEQREEILEVFEMCFLSNKEEKSRFWKRVWEAGEVEAGEPISQDSFEMCLLKAKDILFDRGLKVFTRTKPRFRGSHVR